MRPTLVRLANAARRSARESLNARLASSAYPVIEQCPSPTCQCADMPPDLDIEREKPLDGTMAAHAEQVLIMSSQSDWTSKIEDAKDLAPWGELAYQVKRVLGKDGEFHDPYHNVAINACSFKTPLETSQTGKASALLFPSFKMVDSVGTDQSSVSAFVKTFLLPTKLHAQHDSLSEEEKAHKTRDTANTTSPRWAGKVHPITAPTIMVCSHNTRDVRCGVLGPLLHAEFIQYVNKRHTLRNRVLSPEVSPGPTESTDASVRSFASHPEFRPDLIDQNHNGAQPVNVGMVSHVGGHKWAGNVIVYIPPDYHCNHTDEQVLEDKVPEPQRSPLAGKSIWYGRVGTQHVEGIVEQTIGKGKIIGELFRGGVNADGSYLRL